MKVMNPNYERCLTNLSNSLLKYYGLKTSHNTLPLLDEWLEKKEYKNVVLMVYDGMGSKILEKNLKEDSFLRKNKKDDILAVFPPTTTASTTSLLSGLNPNEHGWLGWDLYFKKVDEVVTMFTNNIKDTNMSIQVDSIAEETYPYESIIDKISTKVNAVGLFPFKEIYYDELEEMHEKIIEICNNEKRNFIYAYYDDPDQVEHFTGTNSKDTINEYNRIEKETKKLSKKLKDTLLIIVADHGHLNSECITLREYPDIYNALERDVSIEPRACSFKIKDGLKNKFKQEFEKRFKDDFILYSKEEIIKEKLFGTGKNNPHFEESIGDFIAIAKSNKYFRLNENGKIFKSTHAGLTEDEMLVPCIIVECK